MEASDRNYVRNRYYHQRKAIKDRMELYAGNSGFVAFLKDELEALEREWKQRKNKDG